MRLIESQEFRTWNDLYDIMIKDYNPIQITFLKVTFDGE